MMNLVSSFVLSLVIIQLNANRLLQQVTKTCPDNQCLNPTLNTCLNIVACFADPCLNNGPCDKDQLCQSNYCGGCNAVCKNIGDSCGLPPDHCAAMKCLCGLCPDKQTQYGCCGGCTVENDAINAGVTCSGRIDQVRACKCGGYDNCAEYFDGCNTCQCNIDGDVCADAVCKTYLEPECKRCTDGYQLNEEKRCELIPKCCNPDTRPGNNGMPLCFEGCICCAETGQWSCSIGDGKSYPCGGNTVDITLNPEAVGKECQDCGVLRCSDEYGGCQTAECLLNPCFNNNGGCGKSERCFSSICTGCTDKDVICTTQTVGCGIDGCNSYNDGCNDCTCGPNGLAACTKKACLGLVQGTPYCTGCADGYKYNADTKKCEVDICQFPAEVGFCDAVIPRYYYNKDTFQCELFNYGGCGGNANNFQTLSECQKTCGCGDANKEYNSCGTACPVTCDNYPGPDACIAVCREGCFCKAGLVLDANAKCVKPEECPAKVGCGINHCNSYNDGCNDCMCGENGLAACTKKACLGLIQGTPYCTGCEDGYRLNENNECVAKVYCENNGQCIAPFKCKLDPFCSGKGNTCKRVCGHRKGRCTSGSVGDCGEGYICVDEAGFCFSYQ